ncbi:MAG: hypothetical protein AAF458_12425 [Pseudomonadota bacterium]
MPETDDSNCDPRPTGAGEHVKIQPSRTLMESLPRPADDVAATAPASQSEYEAHIRAHARLLDERRNAGETLLFAVEPSADTER